MARSCLRGGGRRSCRSCLDVADMAVSVVIPAGQIDRDGLHVSNIRALGRALEAVAVAGSANLVDGSQNLVDGFELKGVGVSPRPLVRGDQTSAAIAAASIVAKETRDWLMRQLDVDYPGYGFAVHKGYITPAHEAAVVELGPSPAHRQVIAARRMPRSASPRPPKTQRVVPAHRLTGSWQSADLVARLRQCSGMSPELLVIVRASMDPFHPWCLLEDADDGHPLRARCGETPFSTKVFLPVRTAPREPSRDSAGTHRAHTRGARCAVQDGALRGSR